MTTETDNKNIKTQFYYLDTIHEIEQGAVDLLLDIIGGKSISYEDFPGSFKLTIEYCPPVPKESLDKIKERIGKDD